MAQAFDQTNRYSDDELKRRRDFDRSHPLDRDEQNNQPNWDRQCGENVFGHYGFMCR